ncbi:hypothetical protein NESM_000477200 [Novymonas esmeraldas]|uniref:Transmembrane protein n=1 Tax=Novymonas esmeraldas TaxID=1808958 RepID=A0AAW0EPC2_9TRYP
MADGGGPSSSTGGAVRSAQDATHSVQERLRTARKNPEKEIGIPLEELERRQREARKPRQFVSSESSRSFDVKSSARAQQVMSQGVDKYQREKRQRDLKSTFTTLRKVQVLLCVFGAGFFGWLAVTYLLPQYAAVQDRNRRMQLRYDRAQQSMVGWRDSNGSSSSSDAVTASTATNTPPVGPVVRVFRVHDDGDGVTRRPIE